MRPVRQTLIALISLALFGSLSFAEPTDALATDQAELARKFARLETLAKRIAELTEAEDPARAEQLRSAIRKSQELELPRRFDAIVALLEAEQLAAASKDQAALSDQLQVLLRLLLADPQQARDEAERKRLLETLKTLKRQIRTQQELRNESQSDADAEALAERQEALANEVAELAEKLTPAGEQKTESSGEQGAPTEGDSKQSEPREANPSSGEPSQGESQPSDGDSTPQGQPGNTEPSEQDSSEMQRPSSPQQRAAERIQAARKRMIEAAEDLKNSQRKGAGQKQAEAQRRLEDAREEIEQALRQLREEELQRRLEALASRLRRMLAEQMDIYELTVQAEVDRPNRGERATAIAATGLANREEQLTAMADSALRLLREDGQSIAYPEVIEQVRDDMRQVAERLRDSDLASVTQRLQKEIVESLEEALDSLDKTIQEMQDRQQQRQQGGQAGGEAGDPAVVDKLAELRMIRAIQARILRRTSFWDELRESGEVESTEAQASLERLAQRQARLIRAIRNVGKPQGR